MTFGVIEKERSLLAMMIAFACESLGHHCLVFKDIVHVTRILHAVRIDAIVIDIQRPGLNALDWLETMVPSWPDLPSRILLLTGSELTPNDVERIQMLRAEVVSRPRSIADVKIFVMERLQQARSDRTGGAPHGLKQQVFAKRAELG